MLLMYTSCCFRYPVGHPDILVCNNESPLNTDISLYYGIALVKILPPRNLYHPVLPFKNKATKKLVFALCKKCADESNILRRLCTCSDEERAFIGK